MLVLNTSGIYSWQIQITSTTADIWENKYLHYRLKMNTSSWLRQFFLSCDDFWKTLLFSSLIIKHITLPIFEFHNTKRVFAREQIAQFEWSFELRIIEWWYFGLCVYTQISVVWTEQFEWCVIQITNKCNTNIIYTSVSFSTFSVCHIIVSNWGSF